MRLWIFLFMWALLSIPITPPQILIFTSDANSIEYTAVEAGTARANFTWRAVNIPSGYRMQMHALVGEQWMLIGSGFAPEKSDSLVIAHPLAFRNPLYRLSVVDRRGTIVTDELLEIPYATTSTRPTIEAFNTPVESGVPAAVLREGIAHIPVEWALRGRASYHQPIFEQMLPGLTMPIVAELPRAERWLPQSGQGTLRLVHTGGDTTALRMRTVNVHSHETYDERVIQLSIKQDVLQPGASALREVTNQTPIHMTHLTLNNVRAIYTRGQVRGNNPNMFTYVGDSNLANGSVMCNFGRANYDLGSYQQYTTLLGRFNHAFCHHSHAAGAGFDTTMVRDSLWATATECKPGETPLSCEIRAGKPAFAFVYIGVQDLEHISWYADMTFERYRVNLTRIVRELTEHGVVPILSTFPTNESFHGDGAATLVNNIIRETAALELVPLIDLRATTLDYPNNGTDPDGYHMSTPPDGATRFNGNEAIYARTLYELAALQILDDMQTLLVGH